MHFELQQGMYEDNQVPPKRYEVVDGSKPIIESDSDLVAAFGSEKFQRLTDAEVGQNQTPKSGVAIAAERGAAELGTDLKDAEDVTAKFPVAQAKGLRVWRKTHGPAKNEYHVMDGGRLASAGIELTNIKTVEQFLDQEF